MFVTKAQDTKGLPFLNVSLMQFQNGSSLSDIATPYSIIRTNLSSGDDGRQGHTIGDLGDSWTQWGLEVT